MKRHKAIRFLMILAVLVMLTTFLTMIIKENYETDALDTVVLILFITLTMWLGYRHVDLHHNEHSYEELLVVVWVPVGAVACYILNIVGGLGGVLSAAITGTLASYIPVINKKSDYLKKLPPAIYCGSFIGMSSLEIAPSISFVFAAGILAGVFLLLSKSLFLGIGGKLGMVAFGGVILVSFLYWLST